MRAHRRCAFRAAAFTLLCWLCLPALHATTGVRELPSAPQERSAAGTDYNLHTVTASGQTVTVIDVRTATGDWLRPDAAHLSASLPDAPAALQAQLQWFYGSTAGWMAVPAGWRVQRATIGADGGTVYTFAAPDGTHTGWLTYTVIPACVGCILDEANGLLPGAGEHLAARSGNPESNLGQTNPVMNWQSHQDDCTALFRYRSGGLTVHAAVLGSAPITVLDTQKGELSLAEVYAALPASKGSLADFLIGHFQQAFPACHAPNGWAG